LKKIGLAVPSFAGGGAERVMITLANKFHDWGYGLDIIVETDRGPYRNMLNSEINTLVLVSGSDGKIKKLLRSFFLLWKYFRSDNDKVIMSTIKEFNIFFLFVKWLSGSKIPLIVREADTLDRLFVTGGWRNKLLLFFMKKFYPKATFIIANSNITRSDVVEHIGVLPKSVQTIYNPLNLESISGHVSGVEKSKKYKIVACGRLHMKKNFCDLIAAFPFVLKKYPESQLVILGEGEERERLHAQISQLGLQNSVHLIGFIDNPYEHFASAHVFVQTSLWEGFGYVLVEAMACGTPVVAYDSKGAMREILADGKYGKLVPVGNLPRLAEAIIEQVENPTSPELLAEAVARFDVDKIAKEYLDVLGVAR
jgi:glycosyltransferase involved in cell wall biosynthesis